MILLLLVRAVLLLSFDFSAAFPSMARAFLWEVLSAYGLGAQFLHAIQLLYEDQIAIITVGGVQSEPFSVLSGVRQGCPLSVVLFDLGADCLLRHFLTKLRIGEPGKTTWRNSWRLPQIPQPSPCGLSLIA